MGSLEETTLDEPVLVTVLRDVKMVIVKMRKVMLLSADSRDELRNWFVFVICVRQNERIALYLYSRKARKQHKTLMRVGLQGFMGTSFLVPCFSNSSEY